MNQQIKDILEKHGVLIMCRGNVEPNLNNAIVEILDMQIADDHDVVLATNQNELPIFKNIAKP